MHENNFEKRVKEKMEELRIPPPERIWENIAKDLPSSVKRRIAFWWLFLFIGLALLGGGYYFTNRTAKKLTNLKTGQRLDLIEHPGQSSPPIATIKQKMRSASEIQIGSTGQRAPKAAKGNHLEPLQVSVPVGRGSADSRIGLPSKTRHGSTLSKPDSGIDKLLSNLPSVGADRSSRKTITKAGQTIAVIDQPDQDLALPNHLNRLQFESDDLHRSMLFFSYALTGSRPHPDFSGPQSTNSKHQTKASPKKTGQWHSGFTITVGTSSVNRSLFTSINRTNIPPSSFLGPGSRPPSYPQSRVSPDLSFGVGDFLYKELSSRVTLSAGINYRYYSTTILTGKIVDSSLNYAGSNRLGLPANVSSYFRSGTINRFVNQYHFIELPVAVDFGLHPTGKIQLVWETGASFCVLLTSNALLFNPAVNVYYKDSKQFNGMGVNASTALMIKAKVGKTYLQIGPQLQYGLTGLLHKDTQISQHLLYGGIKFMFLPKKD